MVGLINMEEISLSVFNHGQEAIKRLQSLLKEFEQEYKIRVRLEMVPWSAGWSRLAEIALYHIGPDVSEIGSTWIMDFVRMDALRPFSAEEIEIISSGKTYFQSCRAGGIAGKDEHSVTWAVPLGADARAVFYRRDLFQQARVDEATAFRNAGTFDHALGKLKAAGIEVPLALPSIRSQNSLHCAASWVWGLGGDFLSADGKKIEFDRVKALDGFKAYYALAPYLGKKRLDEYDSDVLFSTGGAAVTMSGAWVISEYVKTPEVADNLVSASIPGTPFVGSEQLIIWKHARRSEMALKLVEFISSAKSAETLFPKFGLPSFEEGWKHPPFNAPDYGTFLYALKNGRSFPTSQLWGMVEKRLVEVMAEIWDDVFTHPKKLDTILEQQLGSLAQRLRATLN